MEDSFKLLENRIRDAVEEVRRLRSEKASLAQQLEDARANLTAAAAVARNTEKRQEDSGTRQAELQTNRELRALKREREEIKTRLAKMLDVLEELG
jgi:predicted  nucleic acid-binding Zn-ribbon protein